MRPTARTRIDQERARLLLDGGDGEPDVVRSAATSLGFDGGSAHRVLAAVVRAEPGASTLVRSVIETMEGFFASSIRVLFTAVRDNELTILILEPNPAMARDLADACLRQVNDRFSDACAVVGVGSVCCLPGEIARSYVDARRATDVFARTARGGGVATIDDLGLRGLLGRVGDPTCLNDFVREAFGELCTESNGVARLYLSTLRSYFRHNNSPQRAARELHVHPNTVTYRIRRVEELAGLDFRCYQDRLIAQVALEIIAMPAR